MLKGIEDGFAEKVGEKMVKNKEDDFFKRFGYEFLKIPEDEHYEIDEGSIFWIGERIILIKGVRDKIIEKSGGWIDERDCGWFCLRGSRIDLLKARKMNF